ncbi:hypothetical protein [Parabacteroides timonensis]|uniref:hypothetical protein n=1 Tax=Parabacteroides timonensis TaxID=1871013 RepID=UPI001B30FCBB|nr:hypothetical protein [Parabacteroides timonensis]
MNYTLPSSTTFVPGNGLPSASTTLPVIFLSKGNTPTLPIIGTVGVFSPFAYTDNNNSKNVTIRFH